jgi:hypothetical protein
MVCGRPAEDFIGALADEGLMYVKEGHCLSLAVAARFEMAMARILDEGDRNPRLTTITPTWN